MSENEVAALPFYADLKKGIGVALSRIRKPEDVCEPAVAVALQPQGPAPQTVLVQNSSITIGGDGTVSVVCSDVRVAEQIASRLAERTHKRLVTDRAYV